MPYSIDVESCDGLVVVHWRGIVTNEELQLCQDDLREIPNVEALGQISDFSEVDSLNISAEGIQSVTRDGAKRDTDTPIRLAMVVGSKLAMGFARMYESHRSLEPNNTRVIRIFYSREEAIAWLQQQPTPG